MTHSVEGRLAEMAFVVSLGLGLYVNVGSARA